MTLYDWTKQLIETKITSALNQIFPGLKQYLLSAPPNTPAATARHKITELAAFLAAAATSATHDSDATDHQLLHYPQIHQPQPPHHHR